MAAPIHIAAFSHAGSPTTAPTCTLPATVAGQIIEILVANGGSNTPPDRITGTSVSTGGLRWIRKAHAPGSGTTMNGSIWWARARGNHTGQTVIATTVDSGSMCGDVIGGCKATGIAFDTEVLADSPAFYAVMDESSGAACVDAIGGAAGTYNGTFVLAQPSLLDGDLRTCVDFNGSNAYAQFADRSAFDVGTVGTLTFWFYVDSESRQNGIVDFGSGDPIVRMNTANQLLLRCNNVGDVVASNIGLRAGMLYHGAVKWNTVAGTAKILVNGIDVTGTVTSRTFANAAHPFNIGAADGGSTDFIDGRVARVAYYKTELADARIIAQFKAGMVDPYDFCTATGANAASTTATGDTTTGIDRLLVQGGAIDGNDLPNTETINGVTSDRRSAAQSTGGADTSAFVNTLTQSAAGATGSYVATGIGFAKVWIVAALMPESSPPPSTPKMAMMI